MEKTELTVSIEQERLNVLNYFLAQDGTSAQKELERMLTELYENKVPQETRGYIDSIVMPLPKPRRPPRSSARPRARNAAAAPVSGEPMREERHEQ